MKIHVITHLVDAEKAATLLENMNANFCTGSNTASPESNPLAQSTIEPAFDKQKCLLFFNAASVYKFSIFSLVRGVGETAQGSAEVVPEVNLDALIQVALFKFNNFVVWESIQNNEEDLFIFFISEAMLSHINTSLSNIKTYNSSLIVARFIVIIDAATKPLNPAIEEEVYKKFRTFQFDIKPKIVMGELKDTVPKVCQLIRYTYFNNIINVKSLEDIYRMQAKGGYFATQKIFGHHSSVPDVIHRLTEKASKRSTGASARTVEHIGKLINDYQISKVLGTAEAHLIPTFIAFSGHATATSLNAHCELGATWEKL